MARRTRRPVFDNFPVFASITAILIGESDNSSHLTFCTVFDSHGTACRNGLDSVFEHRYRLSELIRTYDPVGAHRATELLRQLLTLFPHSSEPDDADLAIQLLNESPFFDDIEWAFWKASDDTIRALAEYGCSCPDYLTRDPAPYVAELRALSLPLDGRVRAASGLAAFPSPFVEAALFSTITSAITPPDLSAAAGASLGSLWSARHISPASVLTYFDPPTRKLVVSALGCPPIDFDHEGRAT